MLPNTIIINSTVANEALPSMTYNLDIESKRISGSITDEQALIQSVDKIMRTKRYANVIYNGLYGVDIDSLVGQSLSYIEADLPRRVREALLQDERILSVDSVLIKKLTIDSVDVTITISSIYGKVQWAAEVIL